MWRRYEIISLRIEFKKIFDFLFIILALAGIVTVIILVMNMTKPKVDELTHQQFITYLSDYEDNDHNIVPQKITGNLKITPIEDNYGLYTISSSFEASIHQNW